MLLGEAEQVKASGQWAFGMVLFPKLPVGCQLDEVILIDGVRCFPVKKAEFVADHADGVGRSAETVLLGNQLHLLLNDDNLCLVCPFEIGLESTLGLGPILRW